MFLTWLKWNIAKLIKIEYIHVYVYTHTVSLPRGSAVKNPPAMQELQETQVRSLGQKDPLEKGMATHSSILAWRIPWTEESGGLQSTCSQSPQGQLKRLSTHTRIHTNTHPTCKFLPKMLGTQFIFAYFNTWNP